MKTQSNQTSSSDNAAAPVNPVNRYNKAMYREVISEVGQDIWERSGGSNGWLRFVMRYPKLQPHDFNPRMIQ